MQDDGTSGNLDKSPETSQDLTRSHEIPQHPVEIPEDQRLSIVEALELAKVEGLKLGKSTLQRRTKHWHDLGEASAVKSILVTNREGHHYVLDRDSFLSWVLEELPQQGSDTSANLTPPPEVSRDTVRQPQAGPMELPASPPTPLVDSMNARYVARLEHDLELLEKELGQKNEQIASLSQRFSETQTLLGAMQRMLAPMLGQADPFKRPSTLVDSREAPESGGGAAT